MNNSMELITQLPESGTSVVQKLLDKGVMQKIESIQKLLPDTDLLQKIGAIQQTLEKVDKETLTAVVTLVKDLHAANGDFPKMIGILVMNAITNPKFVELLKNSNLLTSLMQNAEQLQSLLK